MTNFYKALCFSLLLNSLSVLNNFTVAATSLTLPADIGMAGSPFGNCSLVSSTTYHCASTIKIPTNTTITLTSNLTVNVNGALTIGNNSTFVNNGNGFSIFISTTEDMVIGNKFSGPVSLSATGKTINIGNNANLTGNLTASTLNIKSGTVEGVCSPSNSKCSATSSAPTVTTSPATTITGNSSTVNGIVSSNNSITTVTFDYGLTTNYGNSIAASPSPLPANSFNATVSGSLTGLQCSTIYHYRVNASNTSGSAIGSDLTFSTASCATSTVSSFNAFDSSTPANSTSGVIRTKIADSSFSIDVVAISNTQATSNSFNGVVKVEIVDATSDQSCTNMATIQSIANSYTFNPSIDNGRHTFSNIIVKNAYQNALIRTSYPASSPSIVSCSSDHLSIRPSYLIATATDSGWNAPGTSRALNGNSASSNVTHKAGQPFTLTVTAMSNLDNVTPNYSSTLSPTFVCYLPSNHCSIGLFSIGSLSFTNGIAVSNSASYSEVGAISITLTDTSFTQIDASDGTTASLLTINSPPIVIGRFIPDHFDVTLNSPSFTPACGSFTYLGQPVKYSSNPVASIVAKNAFAQETKNYGLIYKISPSDTTYGITPVYTEASQTVATLSAGVNPPLASGIANGSSSLTFADTTSSILSITKNATPIKNFTANLAMSFVLQDTDGVAVGNVNGASASNPVSFGSAAANGGIAFDSGKNDMRWGRLTLANANGSELAALSSKVSAEYYNGYTFVTNSNDSCTTLSLSNDFSLSNPSTQSGTLQAGTTTMTVGGGTSTSSLSPATLNAGSSNLSFSAPGFGNTGYINITSSLSSSLPWLTYNWNQSGSGNNSPKSVITFGVYQGNSKMIFMKEIH